MDKEISEQFGLNYLINDKQCPPHELEPTSYYLGRYQYGNSSWNEKDQWNVMALKVRVCKKCKGVYAE